MEMTSKSKEDYWSTTGILRQIMRNKLQQEILISGFMISKSASEIENNFYVHARTREEYLTYNARLILNFREMGHKARNSADNSDQQSDTDDNSISELRIIMETRAINDIISELNYMYMMALEDISDTQTQSSSSQTTRPSQKRSKNSSNENDNIVIELSEDSDGDNYFNMSSDSTVNLSPHISLKSEMSSVKIWSGILEFQIKRAQQCSASSAAVASKKTILNYTLNCDIFAHTVRGEPQLSASKWPDRLLLSIISRQVIAQLLPILAHKSHHLGMNFVCHTSDSEFTAVKLTNIMSDNFCGCVQFDAESNVRIMIVLYLQDKRMFIGFVPYDQNQFFQTLKPLIERSRTDQRIITRRSGSLPNPIPDSRRGFNANNAQSSSQSSSVLRSSSAPSAVNQVQNPILLSLLNP